MGAAISAGIAGGPAGVVRDDLAVSTGQKAATRLAGARHGREPLWDYRWRRGIQRWHGLQGLRGPRPFCENAAYLGHCWSSHQFLGTNLTGTTSVTFNGTTTTVPTGATTGKVQVTTPGGPHRLPRSQDTGWTLRQLFHTHGAGADIPNDRTNRGSRLDRCP